MTQRERSVLCVPASNWRMIEKAALLVVDLAFIDLEDAVAPNAKVESRQQVIKAFHSLDWRGKPGLITQRLSHASLLWKYAASDRCVEATDCSSLLAS